MRWVCLPLRMSQISQYAVTTHCKVGQELTSSELKWSTSVCSIALITPHHFINHINFIQQDNNCFVAPDTRHNILHHMCPTHHMARLYLRHSINASITLTIRRCSPPASLPFQRAASAEIMHRIHLNPLVATMEMTTSVALARNLNRRFGVYHVAHQACPTH